MVEKRIRDSQKRKRNLGMDMDTDFEQCSVCAGKFKKRGLKIHQAKAGCAEQLSGSHRKTSNSEATGTQDTNHSDAHGRVNLKTTHRGNGVQNMEAMDKLKNLKMTGESRTVEGNVFAKRS